MPQTPTFTPEQRAAIAPLIPVAGDPPAVVAQKQAALQDLLARFRDGAPPMRGTGYGTLPLTGVEQARGAADSPNQGASIGPAPRWRSIAARVNTAVDDAARGPAAPRPPAAPGVAPMGAAPMRGTSYGTAALTGVERARAAADSPHQGAAFSADPRRRPAPDAANVMLLTDPPQFRQQTITNDAGRPLTPAPPPRRTLTSSPYDTPASAASPAVPPAAPRPLQPGGPGRPDTGRARPLPPGAAPGPAPAAPSAAGGSLNFSDYQTGPPKTSPYGLDAEEEEDAPEVRTTPWGGDAPGAATLGGGAATAARAPGGPRRPAAKAPPPGRASVPSAFLGPDVAAQTGAAFARQAPADRLGSATGPAEAAFAPRPEAPIGTLAPALQRQAIEQLLSQVDVSPQVGGAPVALGAAPPPEEADALSTAPDPEVSAMVEALLAEARRNAPRLDRFSRRRTGRQAYFGGS